MDDRVESVDEIVERIKRTSEEIRYRLQAMALAIDEDTKRRDERHRLLMDALGKLEFGLGD